MAANLAGQPVAGPEVVEPEIQPAVEESHRATAPGDAYPALFRGYVLRSLARVLGHLGDLEGIPPADFVDQALHNLDFGLNLPSAWPQAAGLLVGLAPLLEQAGYRDQWLPFLARGIEAARRLRDGPSEAELLLQQGIIFQQQGRLQESIESAGAAAEAFRALGDDEGQARALSRLAYVAWLQGRGDDGQALVDRAQALLAEDSPARAYCLHVQAALAELRQDWELAAATHQQGLLLWQALGRPREMAWTLSNLGTVLRRLGRREEALAAYQQALALFDQANDPLNRALTLHSVGNLYLTNQQWQEALPYYGQAEETLRLTGDPYSRAALNNNKGFAYRQLGLLAEAEAAHLAAIKGWRQMDSRRGLANSLDGLGLVRLQQGRCAEAVAAFREALDLLTPDLPEPGAEGLLRDVRAHLAEAEALAAV